MEVLLIGAVLLGLVYFGSRPGGLGALIPPTPAQQLATSIAQPTTYTPTPVNAVPPPQFTFASSQVPGAGSGAPGGQLNTTQNLLIGPGAQAGAMAIPVVGVAVSAIMKVAASLLAAHNLRLKQATSENAAMNVGVQGWDSDTLQVNKVYNARQITAQEAITLMKQVMAQYWALVTPQIQPGRNGCSGGNTCPPLQQPGGAQPCVGSIGAACCVGCEPLQQSFVNVIAVLQVNGGTSTITEVYGSKYGGQQRNAYTLTWRPS